MKFANQVPTPRGYPAIGNPGVKALAGHRLKARLQKAIAGFDRQISEDRDPTIKP
jgi:hypothetical protein